jgi:type I restriction enzyme S subunit
MPLEIEGDGRGGAAVSSVTGSNLYPTGIAWLGDIPEHWDVRRLKYIVDFCGGGTPSKSDEAFWGGDIPWVSPKDMKTDLIQDTEDHITEAAVRASATRMVPAGAVLLVVRSGILRHSIPVAIAGRPLALNQDMKALIPKGHCEPRYLKYTIQGRQHALRLAWTKTGATVQSIEHELLANTLFPVPPLAEQRAIADFLDEKTAAIDALIAKKERLIELLEERRLTMIQERVAGRQGHATRLKASGLQWLGDIPAHWEVVRVRHVARLETGHTPSRQHPEYWVPEECTIPWFTLADVWQIRDGRREYVEETAEKVSPIGLANSAARLLPAGTVILSRTASVGFSGVMAIPMATSQDFVNWVCGPRIRPLYLLYVFRAMRQEFRRLTMGSTHQTIYMPDVREFKTPLPPVEEQDAIIAELRRDLCGYNGLDQRLRAQIDKLREYRQTLISAAVTGQIDIRKEIEVPA